MPAGVLGDSVTRRRSLALWFHGLSACALIGAYVTIAPPSHWRDPVLLVTLGAMMLIAYTAEVTLNVKSPGQFDPGFALAVIALAVAGPLPALILFGLPDLIGRVLLRRYPLWSVGFLGNLVSYAAAALAAGGVLALAHAHSLQDAAFVLVAAGLVFDAVNFTIAILVTHTLWHGQPASKLLGQFVETLPATLGLLVLVTLTALALPLIGILALLLLTPLVLMPHLAGLLRHRAQLQSLTPARASALYAHALATAVGLSRRRRRQTALAAGLHATGAPPRHIPLDDLFMVHTLAWQATERWDGTGGPTGAEGHQCPLECRILSVAAEWSRLTARGGPCLTHVEALLDLELRSGTEFDPRIVRAAGELIAEELSFADPARTATPILHTLPIRSRGRKTLARILASYAPV